MPELTPDPVSDTLARFTPAAGGLDPADVLFRAGRASAPTPWGWKAAVAGLLLTNLAAAGFLAFRTPAAEPAPEAPAPPAVVVVPVVPVPAEPTAVPPASPGRSDDPPWGLAARLGSTDPDRLPNPQPTTGIIPASPPLTPLAARGGELD